MGGWSEEALEKRRLRGKFRKIQRLNAELLKLIGSLSKEEWAEFLAQGGYKGEL